MQIRHRVNKYKNAKSTWTVVWELRIVKNEFQFESLEKRFSERFVLRIFRRTRRLFESYKLEKLRSKNFVGLHPVSWGKKITCIIRSSQNEYIFIFLNEIPQSESARTDHVLIIIVYSIYSTYSILLIVLITSLRKLNDHSPKKKKMALSERT